MFVITFAASGTACAPGEGRMTVPRIIVPEATIAISRRCNLRKAFLAPWHPLVSQIWLYALAWAQKKTGVAIHHGRRWAGAREPGLSAALGLASWSSGLEHSFHSVPTRGARDGSVQYLAHVRTC